MPRLSAIQSPLLRALLEQLRFGGRGALLRQIERTEALAGELDPAFAYPMGFVLQRITGYRGDGTGDGALGAVVRGADLFADLSALVEHLCAKAELAEAELPGGWVTIERLGERWGVTRRTIERYRRRGLVARRVHQDGGVVRVVFTESAVRAFEVNHATLLKSARGFSRIEPGEAARMVGLAERYQRRLGWSATMVAGRLALRFGRSREAVRQVLRRGDGEGAAGLVVRGRLDAAQRAALLDAWEAGERTGVIAARFGITATGVARIVAERDARAMLGPLRAWAAGLDEAVMDEGEDAALLARLSSEAGEVGMAGAGTGEGQACAWPTDLATLLEAGERARPMALEVERARCRLALLVPREVLGEIEALRGRSPSWSQADGWATRLRRAAMLKRSVGCALFGVMLRAIRERLGRGLGDLSPAEAVEVYRGAIGAMGEALDRFAMGHGQRAAGQVSQAIARRLSVSPAASGVVAPSRARPLTRLAEGEAWLAPWSAGCVVGGAWRDFLRGLEAGVIEPPAGVPLAVARSIAARHGVGDGWPMSAAGLADGLGVSLRGLLEAERRLRAAAAAVGDGSGRGGGGGSGGGGEGLGGVSGGLGGGASAIRTDVAH